MERVIQFLKTEPEILDMGVNSQASYVSSGERGRARKVGPSSQKMGKRTPGAALRSGRRGNLTSLRWTAKKPSFCELMETLVTSTRGTSDLICPDFWSARRRLLFVKRKIRDVL